MKFSAIEWPRKAEVPKSGYVCVVNECALYIFNFLGNYRYATKCDYGSAFSKHSEWIDGISQGVATSFGKEQRDVRGDIMKELNRLSGYGRRCCV